MAWIYKWTSNPTRFTDQIGRVCPDNFVSFDLHIDFDAIFYWAVFLQSWIVLMCHGVLADWPGLAREYLDMDLIGHKFPLPWHTLQHSRRYDVVQRPSREPVRSQDELVPCDSNQDVMILCIVAIFVMVGIACLSCWTMWCSWNYNRTKGIVRSLGLDWVWGKWGNLGDA